MDNASERRNRLINPFDDTNFWGKSAFDTRHVAVFNWIYELPFFRNTNMSGKLLGGWQVTGVVQFQTGTPFQVGTSEDFAGIGVTDTQLWNMSQTPLQPKQFSQGAADGNFWFSPRNSDGSQTFTRPAAGTFANQNRNSIDFNNVGFQNWNVALFKSFAITERQSIQFRSEFFNFPNHPNWSAVETSPTSGVFGKVTSKTSNREIQLSLRYSF